MTSLALAVISVVVAALAATFSYRAFQVAHGDAVSDRLFDSLSNLFAALTGIEFAADKLADCGDGELKARHEVRPDFVKFRQAVARVNLARAPQRAHHDDEVGTWILDVANNLAASLLQADESAAIWRRYAGRESELFSDRPDFVSDEQWEFLVQSSSYWTVYGVTTDLPQPKGDPRFDPLDQWWARQVLRSVEVTGGQPSIYHPGATWLTQNARLLSDFGQFYIAPWAEDLVASPARRHRHNGTESAWKRAQGERQLTSKSARTAGAEARDQLLR